MMNAFLFRQAYPSHVAGTLVVGEQLLYTIERPWLDNRSNISCIPAGKYLVKFMARSASGKYRNVWHLQNVPGRSGILIHNGNLVSHSRGCLILGSRTGSLGGHPAVLGSRGALRKLQSIVGRDDFFLHIMGNQNV